MSIIMSMSIGQRHMLRSGAKAWAAVSFIVGVLLAMPGGVAAQSDISGEVTDSATGARPQPLPDGQETSLRFVWPAAGRVTEGFCKDPGRKRDDVINIAVPPRTDVHAVEAGDVIYAGDELKLFPNLIVIQHQDSWASVYANNDERLVKRHDRVERGQVIARVGGGYPNWLHFELRHHGAAVDPLLVLKDASPDTARMADGHCRG